MYDRLKTWICSDYLKRKQIFDQDVLIVKKWVYSNEMNPFISDFSIDAYLLRERKQLSYVKSKITLQCGPPGSGKSPSNRNAIIIDFDIIAEQLHSKLSLKIPCYLFCDFEPFRTLIAKLELEIMKFIIIGPIKCDVIICSCHCHKYLNLIQTWVKRFDKLIRVKFFNLPPYYIWEKIQKRRKTTNSSNFRKPTIESYNYFKADGVKTLNFIENISRQYPEIYVEYINWSTIQNKKGIFYRPVYSLNPDLLTSSYRLFQLN